MLHAVSLGLPKHTLPLKHHRDILEGNDVVAGLHVGDALANGLDNTSSLVSQNDGEITLGILAGEGVGICNCQFPVSSPVSLSAGIRNLPVWQTPV